MSADRSVTAAFTLNAPTTYTITATTGANGTVTPTGATTVSGGSTQSYTITPSTGYEIASITIDGALPVVPPTSPYTFTNIQGNHSIHATFTPIPQGALPITLPPAHTLPARTSGVAPLSVFFDATGTTADSTTRPFHELEYRWTFGDTYGSPVHGQFWQNGSNPGANKRNEAMGPVAAHVFEPTFAVGETQKTFTVTLSAYNGTNTVSTTTQITVQNPDVVFANNTVCFSSTSNFTGCPTNATQVATSSFTGAINLYQTSHKRLLFKRGDTFEVPIALDQYSQQIFATLSQAGPGIVGAYGTGANPRIVMTANTIFLAMGVYNSTATRDWRVMDLDFDGLSKSASTGVSAGGAMSQMTILRVNALAVNMGFYLEGNQFLESNSSMPVYSEIVVADSTFWRLYTFVTKIAFLGNTLGDERNINAIGARTHILRTPFVYKGVLSNNSFHKAVGLALKMHGPLWCDPSSAPGFCANGATCMYTNPAATSTASVNFLATHPECANFYPITQAASGIRVDTSGVYQPTTNTPPLGVIGAMSHYTQQVVISDNKFNGGATEHVHLGPQNVTSDERVRDILLERNWFRGTGTLMTQAIGVNSSETSIRNNICDWTGGTNGGQCFKIEREATLIAPVVSHGLAPNNVWVYNNTGYRGDAASLQSFWFIVTDDKATNVTAINNLAYMSPYNANSNQLMFVGAGVAGITKLTNSTDAQMKNTNPFSALSPLIPIDFTLSTGYAVDSGTNVPVFSDFFKTLRPQGTGYDMGAVERP